MDLTFREDYWDDPQLKRKLIDFLIHIHNLDLSLWGEMGFWDRAYRPFSYFEGDKLVSHVCIYSMNMTVRGRQCKVAQVSAVGTLGEYRRKGLNFRLTQKALAWAQANHDFFYLFADEEAYAFYEKCGFRQVDEHKPTMSVPGGIARPGVQKLDVQNKDHREMMYRFAADRVPVSDLLGVSNEKLFMFWCLYFLTEHIYYIADLDILVLYKRENGLITVFDIVGKTIPSFSEIYRYICSENDKTVVFLFMVDKLNLKSPDQIKFEEKGTHLMGNFPLENSKFIFPLTAHA